VTAASTVAVTVNGEAREVAAGTTVATLVAAVGAPSRGVAVAVNAEVVPRSGWSERSLGGGDRVEILTAAQGG
jgi:sulfur carrier protein